MEEIWKDIPGFEGLYQVSNLGSVKSIYYSKSKILKPIKSSNDYYFINIYKNKKVKQELIHRLVYYAFNNILSNKQYVIDHIDNDKNNNCINNLQLVTNRYNSSKDKKQKSNNYNIYKNGPSYLVRMRINQNKYSIITCKKLNDAIKYRDLFISSYIPLINRQYTIYEIKDLIKDFKNKLKK